jgi:hypothetical protein
LSCRSNWRRGNWSRWNNRCDRRSCYWRGGNGRRRGNLGYRFFNYSCRSLWRYKGSSGTFADNCQNCADSNGLILLNKDLLQCSCERGRDFSIDLVCGDLHQWFIDCYRVANLL